MSTVNTSTKDALTIIILKDKDMELEAQVYVLRKDVFDAVFPALEKLKDADIDEIEDVDEIEGLSDLYSEYFTKEDAEAYFDYSSFYTYLNEILMDLSVDNTDTYLFEE